MYMRFVLAWLKICEELKSRGTAIQVADTRMYLVLQELSKKTYVQYIKAFEVVK